MKSKFIRNFSKNLTQQTKFILDFPSFENIYIYENLFRNININFPFIAYSFPPPNVREDEGDFSLYITFSILACSSVTASCLALATPWTVACQAALSLGFPRQEYWSGLLFPSPGGLPDPGIKPVSLLPPALTGRLTIETSGKPSYYL